MRVTVPALSPTAASATYEALHPSSPGSALPPRPAPTVISAFQSGHGWVASGTGTFALNDTTDFAVGSQSAKITTGGAGAVAQVRRAVLASAIDLTGRELVLLVKVDDNTHLKQLSIEVGDNSFTNFRQFIIQGTVSGDDEFLQQGEWTRIVVPYSAGFVTGTPNRAAVTSAQVTVIDDNTGNQVVLHVQRLDHQPQPAEWPTGLLTFTFDDGFASTYTTAAPYLAQYGYQATLYPICDVIDSDSSWMSTAQLQAMQNVYGWDVGAHAYTLVNHNLRFPNLTSADQATEMVKSRAWLAERGFKGIDHFAYPGGKFAGTTLTHARRLFTTARTVNSRQREAWPSADPHKIRAVSVQQATTLSSLQAEVDAAILGRYWLHIIFHDVRTALGTGSNDWLTSDFKSLVDYVNTSGIPVVSLTQALRGRREVPVDTQAVAVGETTIARTVAINGGPTTGSGTLRLTYFTAAKTETVSSLRVVTGSTPASGATLIRLGIYSVAANGDLTLVGSTATDTTLFAASSTAYAKALTASFTKVKGQRYAFGVLFVGTTAPTVVGAIPTGGVASEAAITPKLCAAVVSQADLPGSITSASLTTSTSHHYAALLP